MFCRTAMSAVAAWALASTGCSNAPSPEQCRALLEHLAALDRAETGIAPDAGVGVIPENSTAHCENDISRVKVECALRAKSLEEAARCDKEEE